MDFFDSFCEADRLLEAKKYSEASEIYLSLLGCGDEADAFCKYRLATISNATGDPLTAYELYYEAFALKPDIAANLYGDGHTSLEYVFKGKKAEVETAACPLCGGTELPPKWCYPLAKAKGYNSFFNPVRMWVYCEACHHMVAKEFPEKLFIYNDAPRTPNPALFKYYCGILDKISRYTGGMTLFEVGTGACECLLAAREIGYDTCGIDVIERHVKVARDEFELNAETADFVEFETDSKFDIIIMGDVIEHVSDPIRAMDKARDMLRDGGALWVSTPNFDSAFAIVTGHNDPMRVQQYHLNYFSRHSFFLLLDKCGLMPVDYSISAHYNGSMEVIAVKK